MSPDMGIGNLLLPFFVQAILFVGAVGTTMTLSSKGRIPNRLHDSLSHSDSASEKPLSFSMACQKGLVYAVVAIFLVDSLSIFINLLNQMAGMESDVQPVVLSLASDTIPGLFKLVLVLQCVFLGPVLEEFFFRFTFLPSLAAMTGSVGRAILYSTFFFTLLHGSLFGCLPLALFSFFCSIAYLGTGRIITPIIMHMLYNASGVFFILLPQLFS